MANKYKLNPITGKFDIVGDGGGELEFGSADGSVEITETDNSVDLSVPLVTEQAHGRERKFDKLVRDHSFMNVISIDSSASYATAAEANQSLMDADSEYYPVAGQTIRFVGNDGRLHDYRYNGNYIIDRNGTNNWWCGACYDVANNVWLINRNSGGGTQMKSGRSASGMFWSITDYPASPTEKRVMMASASFGSAVMSGNQSAEYEFSAYGGDETWISRRLGSTANYHSLKRATILVNNVPTDVLLFINTGATRYLPSSLNDAPFVSQSDILNSLGYNIRVSGNDGDLADDVDVFVDGNGKENLFIFWIRRSDSSRHITWVRRNDNNGWNEVDTYTFASGAKVRKCDYKNGFLYCYIGDLGSPSIEADAYVLSAANDTITLLTTYTNTNILIPTAYGIVRIVGYKSIYVDNTLVTLPTTLAANQYLTTTASDGNKAVLIVTGGLQYNQLVGNYAFMLDAEKRKITNDAEWEELPIMTEENHGIVTVEDAVIKSATYDEYLKYTKSDRKLSAIASDRTTLYQNYKIKGTDHEDLWCAATIAEMVDGTTKVYSDEACTVEAGTITAHSYNPNNPLDLTVAIDGTNYRFEYVESKIPVSLATTKALLSLSPTGSGMTQSADNATDDAFHNLAGHLELTNKKIWDQKTWSGLSNFDGSFVWTDGTDIYYSNNNYQYVLDKSTFTWSVKTWNGLLYFYRENIWTDGTDIYYSNGSSQYVLDKTTSTWSVKTWNGISTIYGHRIWTDGTNIYCSNGSQQYILDKSTSTWSEKIWSGLTSFVGNLVWTDGTNFYYSTTSGVQYVLNKSTSTWSEKIWSGLTLFSGSDIWTDGTDIYCSNGSSQYILDKTTSTWSVITWGGLSSFNGNKVWSDGTDSYYSDDSTQYVLNPAIFSDSEFAFRRTASDTWKKVKMSDIEKYINKRQDGTSFITILDLYDGAGHYEMKGYPKGTYLMKCTSYHADFYGRNWTEYTQNNPFRVFGTIVSDSGSTMGFLNDGYGSFWSFDFLFEDNDPRLYEFWISEGVGYLRITAYPNGYDGFPGASETLEYDPEEAY